VTKSLARYDADAIGARILTIRGHKVIFDTDLAAIYRVEVRRLNEQVKRNSARFPEDFAFMLTPQEWEQVRSLRSQDATLKRGQHRKHPPRVFTEHGAIMAANVLNSKRATEMSVFVVRAFVRMRGVLSDTRELARKLAPWSVRSKPGSIPTTRQSSISSAASWISSIRLNFPNPRRNGSVLA